MNDFENITALEALGIAIRSEIDAQNVFKDLAELCENDLLKERLLNMAKEEKKHQIIFERMYKSMFPEVDLVLPVSMLSPKAIDTKHRRKLGIKDVLLLAIEEEKRTFEYYDNFSKKVKDISGQRMFKFIADMEYKHQMVLEAELDIIKKYPNYAGDIDSWDAESRLKTERIKRN